MDLAALQIFRAVVEYGGVNRAAEQLHRVPSNVTTRVKQLEEELGTALFIRDGRGLALTNEGRLLVPFADQLLRLCEEAKAALRNGKPRGVLRIGALESTSAARLPPVLSAYHARFPGVQIELLTGTSGALVARVHAQEIEAAFVAEPFNAAGLATQTVFVEDLVLIAPRSAKGIRTPADIGGRTLIAFAMGCSYRRRLEAWLARGAVHPERVIEFQSYHAIIACVAAGTGIAVVPRSVLALTNAVDELAVTPLPRAFGRARTQLVWRVQHRSVALDAMKAMLAEAGPKVPPNTERERVHAVR